MKAFVTTILMLFLFLIDMPAFSQNNKTPNPATLHVKFLGYKHENRRTPDGGEHGVCIFPDGSECDEWDFFRGICGKQYSYCALKGCDTKTKTEDKGSYKVSYAVCSCKDSDGVIHDIPLLDFMEQQGDPLIKSNPDIKGEIK